MPTSYGASWDDENMPHSRPRLCSAMAMELGETRAAGLLLWVEKYAFANGHGVPEVLLKRKGNKGKAWPLHVFQMVKIESSGIVYLVSQSCIKDQKTWIPGAGRGFCSVHFLHACSSLGLTYIRISTAQIDHTWLILLPLP